MKDLTREDILQGINPSYHGIKIRDIDDLFPRGFTDAELADAYYHLTSGKYDNAAICESAEFDDVDEFYNPGEEFVDTDFILEAVTVSHFSRTEKRMLALNRAMGKHLKDNEDGISILDPVIGKPRKQGTFAYVTVQLPFSDGQVISIIFHSPEGDKKKIGPDDQIVAFRWLLNKRDITHLVAPEEGKEVSLETIGKRVTQLVGKNHIRFVATQKDAVEEQKTLATLKEQVAAVEEQNQGLAAGMASAETEAETIEAKVGNTQSAISKQQQYNADLEAKIADIKAKAVTKKGQAATVDPASENIRNLSPHHPEDAEEIAAAGGYLAVLNNPELAARFEDALDSIMSNRVVDVRNALRSLGWGGKEYGDLSKGGVKIPIDTNKSPSGNNVVGYSYNGIQDDLSQSAEEYAKQIDATIPATGNPDQAEAKDISTTMPLPDALSFEEVAVLAFTSGLKSAARESEAKRLGFTAFETTREKMNTEGMFLSRNSITKRGKAELKQWLESFEREKWSEDTGLDGTAFQIFSELFKIKKRSPRAKKQEDPLFVDKDRLPDGSTIIKEGPFAGMALKDELDYGVQSDTINVYSSNKRMIGYIKKADVEAFKGGDARVFTPLDKWKTTFTTELMTRLGLSVDPEEAETTTSRKDPFWFPTKLPGEIRSALKNVQVRPQIGEMPATFPKAVRKGGFLVMNAARPIQADGENLWQGPSINGKFYAAIDPKGEFSEQNIKANRKLDAWLLAYVSEAAVDNWAREELGNEDMASLKGEELNDFIRDQFFDAFDGLTYPEFLAKFNARGESGAGDTKNPELEALYSQLADLESEEEMYIEAEDTERLNDVRGRMNPVKQAINEAEGKEIYPTGTQEAPLDDPTRETTQTMTGADFIKAVANQLGGGKNQSLADAIKRYNGQMIAQKSEVRAESFLDGNKGIGVKTTEPTSFGKDAGHPKGYSWEDEKGDTHTIVRRNADGKYYVTNSGMSSGFQDIMTDDDIDEAEKRAAANIKSRAEDAAKQAIVDEQEAKKKAEYEDVKGFTDEMSAMQKGKVLKALNRMMNWDGVVTTRKKMIEDAMASGATLSTRQEDKIKPMSRRAFNNAGQREQDEHERKILEAGKKTVYLLELPESDGAFRDITKTEYDYAKFLRGQVADTDTTDPGTEDGVNDDIFNNPYKYTLQEYLDNEKKSLGSDYRNLKSGLEDGHYAAIENHVTGGGTITQRVFDSLGKDKQYHFAKHYNAHGDKVVSGQTGEDPISDRSLTTIEEINDRIKDLDSQLDLAKKANPLNTSGVAGTKAEEITALETRKTALEARRGQMTGEQDAAATPPAVQTLQSIIAGDYDSDPKELDRVLDEAADELEAAGLMEKYDKELNLAADKAAALAIEAAKGVK